MKVRPITSVLLLLALAGTSLDSRADEPTLGEQLMSYLPRNEIKLGDAPENLRQLATAIVREHVPRQHEDTRHWGQTTQVLDGWKVSVDGLQIRTKRRWKAVNHGTWKRYRITQVDPDRNLTFAIHDVHHLDDGRVAFRIELKSKINCGARISKWEYGVRLASVSVTADADVLLSVSCVLATKLNLTRIPPDVILRPEVTNADITLQRFEVHQISKLDGKLAEELGRGLRKLLAAKIEDGREKLVSKINAKIAKNEDKLKLSVHDFVAEKWKEMTNSGQVSIPTSSSEQHDAAPPQPSPSLSHD